MLITFHNFSDIQGLLREDRRSNQVEFFSADFTSKSAAKN